MAEIDAVLRAHPERSFRIGTGELSDSLALDPLTELTRLLVPFFAARRNAVLELKTKTDCVDTLLDARPARAGGGVVVGQRARRSIERDEPGTATLAERLAAARRVQAAGYRVGFHFDPLIEFDGWEAGYGAAIEAIAAAVDPRGDRLGEPRQPAPQRRRWRRRCAGARSPGTCSAPSWCRAPTARRACGAGCACACTASWCERLHAALGTGARSTSAWSRPRSGNGSWARCRPTARSALRLAAGAAW